MSEGVRGEGFSLAEYRLETNPALEGFLHTPLKGLMESYLSWYGRHSAHTGKAKRLDLEKFYSYSLARVPGEPCVMHVTHASIGDFLFTLECKGEAPATINRRLATLKHFFRKCAERVPGFISPAHEIKPLKFEESKPQGLTDEQVARLRAAVTYHNKITLRAIAARPELFQILRQQVVIETLLATGIRVDELRTLLGRQVSPVKENNTWLRRLRQKGGRFRDVYINNECASLLPIYELARKSYIQARLGTLTPEELADFPYFPNNYQATEDPRSWLTSDKTMWRTVRDAGVRAGIPKLHPHKLRHTFAHQFLRANRRDIALLQQVLGHSDPKTTTRYTQRTKEVMALAMERTQQLREPRALPRMRRTRRGQGRRK